jgi:hypothetical protein
MVVEFTYIFIGLPLIQLPMSVDAAKMERAPQLQMTLTGIYTFQTP